MSRYETKINRYHNSVRAIMEEDTHRIFVEIYNMANKQIIEQIYTQPYSDPNDRHGVV